MPTRPMRRPDMDNNVVELRLAGDVPRADLFRVPVHLHRDAAWWASASEGQKRMLDQQIARWHASAFHAALECRLLVGLDCADLLILPGQA